VGAAEATDGVCPPVVASLPSPDSRTAASGEGSAAGASQTAAGTSGGAALLLDDVRLIDGTGAAVQERVDVLVQDGRVTEIAASITAPSGATVLPLAGKTLLPGFIDAHVHLTSAPQRSHAEGVLRQVTSTEGDDALLGAANAAATLRAGFTTVRNVGGSIADRALRDAIEAGHVMGPRMLVAVHSIGITGGHCDDSNELHPGIFGGPPGPERGIADGEDEVRKAVRQQVKLGADVIKICATGGVLSQGDGVGASQLTVKEMRAIVEEAGRAGRKVAAHAHGNEGIREAVEAGVHSIEHGSILDPKTVKTMKRKGIFLVPTLTVGEYVERAGKEGKLSASSAEKAAFVAPKMREFELMVQLGMTPMQAIVAGTSRAAELLGVTDVGRVAPGARADLVVVDGDPLSDVSVLTRPAMVFKDGVLVHRR
jgi:imidazolonepropionase-like amidohydrolase